MFVVCLADFFNLDLLPNGRKPNRADIRAALDEIAENTLAAISHLPTPNEVTVRLYGGWHDADTGDFTEIRRLCGQAVRDFPQTIGVRFRFQIAESLMAAPHLHFERTLRRVPIPFTSLKVDPPASCVLGEHCSSYFLPSWLQGACPEPGCSVDTIELLVAKRQKIADTMLTADALFLASNETADVIVIASDDDDMLPALLVANGVGARVINMYRRDESRFPNLEMIQYQGIQTHKW